MKTLAKFAGIALIVQGMPFGFLVLLMFLSDPIANSSAVNWLFELMFRVYFAGVLLVSSITQSSGCTGMVEGFLLGIPTGILLYSVVIGGVAALVKRVLIARKPTASALTLDGRSCGR